MTDKPTFNIPAGIQTVYIVDGGGARGGKGGASGSPNVIRVVLSDESDALRARLLAAFDLSDRRGNELLVAYAELHAKRYPKEPS